MNNALTNSVKKLSTKSVTTQLSNSSKLKVFIAGFLAFTLSACSSSPLERMESYKEQKMEMAEEKVESILEKTPSWFLKHTPAKTHDVYQAKKTVTNADVQSAIDMATTLALFDIAKKVKLEMSGLAKTYIKQIEQQYAAKLSSPLTIDS